MKKFIFAGVVLASLYVLGLALGPGFNYPLLQTQTSLSSDEIIHEYSCSNEYSWQIVQTDTVDRGNLFETGESSRIETIHDLQLNHKGDVIAKLDFKNGLHPSDRFPTGRGFTKVFIFEKYFFSSDGNLYKNIEVPGSRISEDDFEKIALCLSENLLEVNMELKKNEIGYPLAYAMRIDESIARDPDSNAAEFKCEDGTRALLWQDQLHYMSEGEKIRESFYSHLFGYIRPDGTIHSLDGQATRLKWGTDKELPLPDTVCTNSKGETLQSYFTSFPSRIILLNNPVLSEELEKPEQSGSNFH